MITGRGKAGEAEDALMLGAREYFHKPLDFNALIDLVEPGR